PHYTLDTLSRPPEKSADPKLSMAPHPVMHYPMLSTLFFFINNADKIKVVRTPPLFCQQPSSIKKLMAACH
ncbi:hypothetical protein, partial [Prevotella sp. MGM1]|uniref:hypothetical protein n=1 Tax=Prevotella sp. MGM1 TaxID=2033405 RepID=UPI001E3579D6